MVRRVRMDDAGAICGIYNHYIEKTVITFEEQVVSVAQMEMRIAEVTSAYPWLVLEQGGAVAGYAYASIWKNRSAYRHAAESSIYLAAGAAGQGGGSRLYGALIDALRRQGIHTVIGGVALPNPASVALHEKLGFEKVAHLREVGRKFDRWIDVGYWELLLGEVGQGSAALRDEAQRS